MSQLAIAIMLFEKDPSSSLCTKVENQLKPTFEDKVPEIDYSQKVDLLILNNVSMQIWRLRTCDTLPPAPI